MDPETLKGLLTVAFSVGLSWGTVRATLSTLGRTVEKLEQIADGHQSRIVILETATTLNNAGLNQAIGRVEGQVSALHKRLDNFLGGRVPRPGHPEDATD